MGVWETNSVDLFGQGTVWSCQSSTPVSQNRSYTTLLHFLDTLYVLLRELLFCCVTLNSSCIPNGLCSVFTLHVVQQSVELLSVVLALPLKWVSPSTTTALEQLCGRVLAVVPAYLCWNATG